MFEQLNYTLHRPLFPRELSAASTTARLDAEKLTTQLLDLAGEPYHKLPDMALALSAAERALADPVTAPQLNTLRFAYEAGLAAQESRRRSLDAARAWHTARASYQLNLLDAGSVAQVDVDKVATLPKMKAELVQLAVVGSEASAVRLQWDDLVRVCAGDVAPSQRTEWQRRCAVTLELFGSDWSGRYDWSQVCAWSPTGPLLSSSQVCDFAADPLAGLARFHEVAAAAPIPLPPRRTYLALRDYKIRPADLSAAQAFFDGDRTDAAAAQALCVTSFKAAHKQQVDQVKAAAAKLPRVWNLALAAALAYAAELGTVSSDWR